MIRPLRAAVRTGFPGMALALVWWMLGGALTGVQAQLDEREIDYEAVFKAGLMRGGSVLNLAGKKIGDEGLQWLLSQGDRIKKVKKLDLRYNKLTEKAGLLLAATDALPNLKTLELRHNFLMDAGIVRLAGAKGFPALEKLGLSWNEIRDQGALALSVTQSFPRLKKLDLRGNFLADSTKTALKKRLARLKSLKLEARL
ncbi:MAG: hypothetical protein ACE5ER_05500 [Nitrospinaceae bacterium]